MDDCCEPAEPIGRRRFLRHCGVVAVATPLWWATAGRAWAAAPTLPALADLGIRPRADWAGALAPVGPLAPERDVRFLLVHHTASGNGYGSADVPSLIRGFYDAHTGPDKGWPDVAYNFFVDRFGTVWEGREGSLSGPVQPDATGGSQGFAQLGCFIGDHRTDAPTDDARRAMTRLLAALADAYGIDTGPGATTTFPSRGSNRWPEGESVTAATLSAHRDMSRTECPGDAAYAMVRDEFPAEVSALRSSPESVAPAATSEPAAPPTTTPPPVAAPVMPDPAVATTGPPVPIVVGGVALLVAGVAAAGLRRRPAIAGGAPSTGSHGLAAAGGRRSGSWRLVDDPAPAGPGTSGAAVHEFGEHVLLAALACGAAPTPALLDVLDECRRAARRIERQHRRGSSAQSASAVIGRALARTDTAGIDVAVLVVQGPTCTVIATEPSMGALRTHGAVSRLRPSRVGAASPQGSRMLFASTRPEADVDAVVLGTPAPPAERAGTRTDISGFLGSAADPGTGLTRYRYSFFGLTGVEPTTIGLRKG